MRLHCTSLIAATALMAGLSTTTAHADDDINGQRIYDGNCAGCHDGGRGPQRGANGWKVRLKAGDETLYNHAIEGIGGMPARGGNEALSDEEVEAAVDYLVAPARDR